MNQYLIKLLKIIAIDTEHLMTEYLNSDEISYIDEKITSEQDFRKDFYTDEQGKNLEVLLHFLTTHKEQIITLMQNKGNTDILIQLYMSPVISADYDCFRFDLSKFPQLYKSQSQILKLYRIGRGDECESDLGNSWSTSAEGLKIFYHSSMGEFMLKDRPVFVMEVNDSEILFEGNKTECEVVLKPNFIFRKLEKVNTEIKNQIIS